MVMVPWFSPTKPPAVPPPEAATAPVACEPMMVDPGALLPTRPPAAESGPATLTFPVAKELVIVPDEFAGLKKPF